jgi:hypothetical protein
MKALVSSYRAWMEEAQELLLSTAFCGKQSKSHVFSSHWFPIQLSDLAVPVCTMNYGLL